MLAEDEITIRVAGETLYLRPSLRAAFRLERRFEGFDKLITALADESVTAMAAVIRESTTSETSVPSLIEGFVDMPLHRGIEALREPLIAHVLRLAGHHDSGAAEDDPEAARITFAEHHARLYRIATGWLGWEPATAWNATAEEITEAYQGRVEMLRAIFGGGEADTSSNEPSPEAFNAKVLAFAKAMGTRKVQP